MTIDRQLRLSASAITRVGRQLPAQANRQLLGATWLPELSVAEADAVRNNIAAHRNGTAALSPLTLRVLAVKDRQDKQTQIQCLMAGPQSLIGRQASKSLKRRSPRRAIQRQRRLRLQRLDDILARLLSNVPARNSSAAPAASPPPAASVVPEPPLVKQNLPTARRRQILVRRPNDEPAPVHERTRPEQSR